MPGVSPTSAQARLWNMLPRLRHPSRPGRTLGLHRGLATTGYRSLLRSASCAPARRGAGRDRTGSPPVRTPSGAHPRSRQHQESRSRAARTDRGPLPFTRARPDRVDARSATRPATRRACHSRSLSWTRSTAAVRSTSAPEP